MNSRKNVWTRVFAIRGTESRHCMMHWHECCPRQRIHRECFDSANDRSARSKAQVRCTALRAAKRFDFPLPFRCLSNRLPVGRQIVGRVTAFVYSFVLALDSLSLVLWVLGSHGIFQSVQHHKWRTARFRFTTRPAGFSAPCQFVLNISTRMLWDADSARSTTSPALVIALLRH